MSSCDARAMLFRHKVLVVGVCLAAANVLVVSVFYSFPSFIHRGNRKPSTRGTTRIPASRSEPLTVYFERRATRGTEVDCARLFTGDEEELRKAVALESRQSVPLPSDASLSDLAHNCSRFLQHYGFLLDPLTPLEKNFPLAFSVLVYKQASQVVDLLRAIYRPQNWYCVHVDRKSAPPFRQAMEVVSRCFPNVFLASRSVDVRWGNYTVLEPEVVCMEDLWATGSWRYLINLTGQEFPLRTNYELVRILSAFNGTNDVSASVPSPAEVSHRWQKFLPAPHNISLYKGDVHVVVSRGFVDYVLHSPKAQAFLHWCRQTRHPDEHFFNSLNHNPHLRVPGGSTGERTHRRRNGRSRLISGSVARFKMWQKHPCPGQKRVRNICILNVLDLPRLSRSRELFANKFYADYSRLALQCLAENLHNRTTEQALGRVNFNVTFYEQWPFVRARRGW